MYLQLVFLPVIGSCLAGLFGKHFGSWGTTKITVLCIFLAFLFSIFGFYEISLLNSPVYFKLTDWINVDTLNINWGFMFDTLTITMCIVVSFISCLVHLYSIEYMSHDPHLSRFMCYLSLFTFFMLILITADNFIQMFMGWEGVGLCSYLLINFWFTRIQANKAAIKAMIINRVGDFSLIIGILIIFVNFKSLDYSSVSVLVPFFKNQNICFFNIETHMLTAVGLFIFIGAIGKSAQIGLHTWLPDAMEGPTPVSALIHAATMVTAGIFLITRTSFLYEFVFKISEIIVIIGALTAFFAATIGLVQNDLKRVIAYSTCSQLGYMIFACGLSNYPVGMFHLTNHAFFKALLFLSAGSVIHSINDEQDIRKMGGLKNFLPVTYVSIIVGSLALMGFPFLTAFYSKDVILETAFSKYSLLGYFSYCLGTMGAFFTAFYSIRLIFLTFLSKPNGYRKIICYSTDSGLVIKFVLACLTIPSVFIGYFSKDMAVGMGSDFFSNSIFVSFSNFNLFDGEFIPVFFKTLPVHFSLLGFISGFLIYSFQSKLLFYFKSLYLGKKIYIFLNKKWFFDKIYNEYLSQFFFKFGYSISYKFIDRGVFEFLGPTGLSFLMLNFGLTVHNSQTYLLYHLVISILFCLTISFFIETFKIILINNHFFFDFFDSYNSILNCYVFAFKDILSLELVFINLTMLILLTKTKN